MEPDSLTWLPAGARVIVLIGAREADWAAAAAVGIADGIAARRPRTILVNSVAGAAGPDGLLGASGQPGLTAALAGAATIAHVAVKPEGSVFRFIPAGRPALPLSRLWATRGLAQIVRQVPRRGGTLLLFVGEDELASLPGQPAGEPPRIDGCVLVGRVDRQSARRLGWKILARVQEPTGLPGRRSVVVAVGASSPSLSRPTGAVLAGTGPPPPAAGGDRPRDLGMPSPPRLRPKGRDSLRLVRPVLAVWAAAIVVVWLVWQGLSGWPVLEEDPASVTVSDRFSTRTEAEVATEPAGLPEADPSPPQAASQDRSARDAPAGDSADPVGETPGRPEFGGEDLPYSILIASYAYWDDAVREMRRLERDGGLYFVAPTPIGDRVYYRLLAGALPDRIEGERLMDELVTAGKKERRREWDMRPVRLAFELGTFGAAQPAEDLRDLLHEQRLPGYVLTDGRDGNPAFRVYSGAFETEEAATVLGEQLRESGRDAVLVSRRGKAQ